MVKCTAPGALDLELGNPARSGEQSVAFSATNVSKHLQSLKFFC